MSLLGNFNKQPREIIDFDIDYTYNLSNREDVLTSTQAEASPLGLKIEGTIVNSEDKKIKVIVSGGVTGVSYKVTVLTSTSLGILFEDEVNVIVEEI